MTKLHKITKTKFKMKTQDIKKEMLIQIFYIIIKSNAFRLPNLITLLNVNFSKS